MNDYEFPSEKQLQERIMCSFERSIPAAWLEDLTNFINEKLGGALDMFREACGIRFDYPRGTLDQLKRALERYAQGDQYYDGHFNPGQQRKGGTFGPGVASGRAKPYVPQPPKEVAPEDPLMPRQYERPRRPQHTINDPPTPDAPPEAPHGEAAGNDLTSFALAVGEVAAGLNATTRETGADTPAAEANRLTSLASESVQEALRILNEPDDQTK